ncbi:hypothetical protein [Chryseobacterium shigense]|uniref:Uncharacterized protein n=1 Tax=Chryseobacterium shigense TaxID=297244 RepID=A0A841NLK4_9FLAO|nr:hypothetical protein [Chryseobacterium shigense]MBB6372119.1 hypothetical protein [Chryseobacterium shigense]
MSSLICCTVYQYLKSDIVESHAVLFSCCSVFYNHLFLSLLYNIKYHDTVQWGVQLIAALGLFVKTQILSYYLWLVWAGSSGGLPPLQPVKSYSKKNTNS